MSLTVLVVGLAVLLGGGTRQGFLGDVVVQGLSIVLLLACVWWRATGQSAGRGPVAVPLGLLGLLVAASALQLAPVPEGVGDLVDSRFDGLAAASVSSQAWLAHTPQATWAALVSLLPPIAVYFAVVHLAPQSRRYLAGLVVVLGCMSLVLGFLQVAQGPTSALRFFAITNPTEAVGFFANRNHFAGLLYVTLLLASPWIITSTDALINRASLQTPALLGFVAAFGVVLALTAGLATARSRAGLVIAMVALLAIAVLVIRSFAARPTQRDAGQHWLSPRRILFGLIAFAVLFAAQFGLHRFQSRFAKDPLEDLRVVLNGTTLEAAWQSFPVGTGLGSFVPVYAMVEGTRDLLPNYANRAHNDFVELFLELGALGVVIIALGLVWLTWHSVAAWRRSDRGLSQKDVVLQRVCGVACLLLLAHSLVDYPLRTTALATVFAFCLGVLTAPLPGQARRGPSRAPVTRLEPRPAAPSPDVSPSRSSRSGWLDDVQWPDAWTNTPKSDRS
jgi:O-antigen ligase